MTAATAHEKSISLKATEKRFGPPEAGVLALSSTSIEIAGGGMTILLGPSGCGKTTMLRLIAGLETPTTGTIEVGGDNLWSNGKRNGKALSHLGMVFQEANLFPWLTIEENIALPLKLRGMKKADRLEKAHELCRMVGISGFERRRPRELSGGMRQRAAIARALSYDPGILLMDEPFGALDSLTRVRMQDALLDTWSRDRRTVMFITHDVDEAVYLAGRVVVMAARPGRIHRVIDVDLPYPRTEEQRLSPAFAELRARVWSAVHHQPAAPEGATP